MTLSIAAREVRVSEVPDPTVTTETPKIRVKSSQVANIPVMH